MNYPGGASRLSSRNADIMPRVHATAPRLDCATASSCSRPLILTTFPVSYESNTENTSRMNSARFLRGMVARCALTNAPIKANSGEVGGISAISDGGRPVRSGIKATPHSTPLQIIGRRNKGEGKTSFVHQNEWVLNHFPIQPERSCSADGPADGMPPSPAYRRANPLQRQNAALSDRALCLFQIPRRAPSQAARNLVRLTEGFGVAPPSRLRKRFQSPIHHLPCREIHGDDLGHVVFLKSLPIPKASST